MRRLLIPAAILLLGACTKSTTVRTSSCGYGSPCPAITATPSVSSRASAPAPEPNGKYNVHECNYVLGAADFNTGGYPNARAIASTTVRNTGNVGIVLVVKAHWDVTGGPSIVQTRTERISYSASKRISFSVLIGNRLDALQTAAFQSNWCGVKATITNTFGPTH